MQKKIEITVGIVLILFGLFIYFTAATIHMATNITVNECGNEEGGGIVVVTLMGIALAIFGLFAPAFCYLFKCWKLVNRGQLPTYFALITGVTGLIAMTGALDSAIWVIGMEYFWAMNLIGAGIGLLHSNINEYDSDDLLPIYAVDNVTANCRFYNYYRAKNPEQIKEQYVNSTTKILSIRQAHFLEAGIMLWTNTPDNIKH